MKKNRRNYYRILHVQPDAPVEIIKSSYRTLMQKLNAHPDLGGDEWNAALINEACAVITDPKKRAAYDASLREQGKPRTETPSPRPAPVAEPEHCLFCNTRLQALSSYQGEGKCSRCNSPLTPLTPQSLEQSSRRVIARVPAKSPVHFYDRWPQKAPHNGVLFDLSLNGIGFQSPLALATGTIIKLENERLGATARVISCILKTGMEVPAYHIGAQFLSLVFNEQRGTFLTAHA